MKNKKTKQLLPVGFYDLIFDEAEKNHQNINLAIANFLACGYRLIKAPLVEFENNFLSGKINNALRSVDIISGENIVFRNDITLQISRLLETRLKNHKMPLKICYVGDVLYAKNNELYPTRQQTQTGIEIIGCNKEESIFEVIDNLLVVLEKLTEKKLLIEFSLPEFLSNFLDEIKAENKEELYQIIMKKNISQLRAEKLAHHDIIAQIMLANSNLAELSKLILSKIKAPKIVAELARAQKIEDYFAKKNFKNIEARFDLFGDHKSSYHNEISFDVFCDNFPYPIARGGRYKINEFDAIGATIYMNNITKIS